MLDKKKSQCYYKFTICENNGGNVMLNLQNVRISRGFTQSELAEKLGVRSSTISQYEKGKRSPNIYILKDLAEVLSCTVDDLLK